MKLGPRLTCAIWMAAFLVAALPVLAADFPAPKEGSWVVRDFRSQGGEVAQYRLVTEHLGVRRLWESSRDYNASPGLERIKATLLVINSADDERNPPGLGPANLAELLQSAPRGK